MTGGTATEDHSERPAPVRMADHVAYLFDGAGHGEPADALDLPQPPETGFAWLHVHRESAGIDTQLSRLGLDAYVIDALTAEETRPRLTLHEAGALLNLRGVNLNPGSDIEDMVSVRLWITDRRVIGVWSRPLFAIDDMVAAIARGFAPLSPGDFVARLALRLADRAEPAVDSMAEAMDDLETLVLEQEQTVPRATLSEIRRKAILLRRYLMPQREALTTLEIEDLNWLVGHDRARIREAAERTYRLGEELDALRDRAQLLHDQILEERAERMNVNMLLLAVVTAVFLPLTLITGLLGVNMGGIPGSSDPRAFWVLCVLLVVLGGLCLWIVRRLGLFRS